MNLPNRLRWAWFAPLLAVEVALLLATMAVLAAGGTPRRMMAIAARLPDMAWYRGRGVKP